MAENVKNEFQGTQENMCEAASLGINLYNKQQSRFQLLNLKYTKQWGIDFQKEIDDALGLPAAGERRAVPSEKRSSLIPFANGLTDNWLLLSGVITDVAKQTGVNVEDLLNQAGKANYPEAAKYKWSKVKALGKAGSDFITDNLDWLLNGGKGMDPSFPETYNASVTAYNEASSVFFTAKQDMPFDTTTKVDKMNTVYHKLVAMLEDGKKINRRDKVLRSRFAYSSLLALVQGHGESGIRFSFFEEDTQARISTSTAVFVPGGNVFPCGADGVMLCKIAAGSYDCTITTPGYDTITMQVTIRPGVVSPKKIKLRKTAEVSQAV